MGLLDIFKKDKEPQNRIPIQEKKPFDINYVYYEDGSIQIDFLDNDSRITLGQFYDTTRLIIPSGDIALGNHQVSSCYVSWYGSTDAEYLDPKLDKQTRKNSYREVLAEIDRQQIRNPQYVAILMRGLLKQSRVEEYLSNGLQEQTDRPCGKYIGGIRMTSQGYSKVFNQEIGNIAHNTYDMRMQRAVHKRNEEERKAAEIAAKRRQISELQGQIDDLSR